MFLKYTLLICLLSSGSVSATSQVATQKDIDEIRNELKKIVEAYEQKISELEQRLQVAEEISDENTEFSENLAIEVSQQGNLQAANTYNPGIGIILNGHIQKSTADDDFSINGFMLAEESGPGADGFELGESEMNLSANIDDKFYASVTLAFGDEVEVEEAYLQTIALPNGLSFKAGRFFSNVGYLANKHQHTDNFSNRPLVYAAFLGGQYGDDGIQLSWLASTEFYWESGVEFYRGENFPASGAGNNGAGVWTAFTHIGNDINNNQSWRAGLSFIDADVDYRETSVGETFTGSSQLLIADFVWKWAPDGNSTTHNAIIQAEYLSRSEEGIFTDSYNLNHVYDSNQQGWYVQGIYQFYPQWRIGIRRSQLSADRLPDEFLGSTLDSEGRDPFQSSLMIDWSNSEFSRIRLQYTQDQSTHETNQLWTLQYIAAFGAHGAHSF